jgi:hypothetical protein
MEVVTIGQNLGENLIKWDLFDDLEKNNIKMYLVERD